MPNFSFGRNERLYLTKETTYGTAVAAANTNYCRHIKLGLNNEVALLARRDKTGSRSATPGVRGRAHGKWSTEMSLVAGSAGVVPNCDVLLQMLFGAVPTVVATTSVTYALTDNIISGNLWSYRTPSTLDQRVGIGSILSNFTFTLGQDVAEWSADGESLYVLGSNFYAVADATQRGGLGSFAAEPSTPVSAGGIIAGFTGSITVDGVTLANIRTATIKGSTGNALVKDTFGSYYPTSAEGDERNFTFGFSAYDDDSAGIETLKEVADSKTAVNATVAVGTVAGSIFTFTVKGIQLASPQLDDSQRRYVATFGDSRATGSSLSAKDELGLVIT